MALPTTRDVTMAPGSQIPSTLLNNLQDMIIGGKHGALRQTRGIGSMMSQASEFISTSSGPNISASTGQHSAGNVEAFVGHRIQEYWGYGEVQSGGDTFKVELRFMPSTTTTTTVVGSKQTSPSGAAFHEVGEVLGAPHVVVDDRLYTVFMEATVGNAGNITILGYGWEVDLP